MWVRPSVQASMKRLIRTPVNIYLEGEPKARCWIGMLSIPITRSILIKTNNADGVFLLWERTHVAWVRPSVQAPFLYAIFFPALSKSKFDMNQTMPQIV
ncbi:hypothetical protein BCV73_01480 [Paenibacillus sp. SSG-1]|nr:hypothetical protein BCV73_01480 [Paenibacillus sp. SSG-1]